MPKGGGSAAARQAAQAAAQAAQQAAALATQGMPGMPQAMHGQQQQQMGMAMQGPTQGNGTQQQQMPGLPPPNVDAAAAELSLQVLRRSDPTIMQVLAKASHASLYAFDTATKAWSKSNVEGALFVVRRQPNVVPQFQLIVMNRQSPDNLVVNVTHDTEFELKPPYLLYKAGHAVNGLWFFDEKDAQAIAHMLQSVRAALPAQQAMPPQPVAPPPQPPQAMLPQQPQMPPQQPQMPQGGEAHVSQLLAKLGMGAGAPAAPGMPQIPHGAMQGVAGLPPMPQQSQQPQMPGMPPGSVGTPPMSAMPAPPRPPAAPRLSKDVVRVALQRLVQDDRFVSLVAAELEAVMMETPSAP